MVSTYLSLFFTVVLLVTTTYFIMGGLPLLTLAHDTPLDGRFIRRFFEIYYSAALVGSAGATASFALWNRPLFAMGTAAIGLTVLGLRRSVLSAMARLGAKIESSDPRAIADFRKVHVLALLVNLLQLVVLVWGVIHIDV